MIGNAGTIGAIVVRGLAVGRHLGDCFIGNHHRICAQTACGFFATCGREQDHVEERPVVVRRVVIGPLAVAAAEIVGDGPARPREAIEHVLTLVLDARRVEVAGGEHEVVRGQGVAQGLQVLVGGLAHGGRVVGRRKVHGEAGQDRAARQFEVGLEDTARIARALREVRDLERVQHRFPGERQFRQEGHVDASRVVSLDEYRGLVAEVCEMLLAQALEDADVFDFLKRNDIGAATDVDLPNRVRQHGELVTDRVLAPVEVQALIAPLFDGDLVTGGDMRLALLGLDRQVGLVVLARVVDVVEQVLGVHRHHRYVRPAALRH